LGNFARTAGLGLAAVSTAALAVRLALAIAVRGTIDNADHLDDLAQSAGVSVEALTSVGYAAKFSGIDTESLATGLRKPSQNMLAVAQGSAGPVATAFTAQGISGQNANGKLRGSDEVVTDVMDKFSAWRMGAKDRLGGEAVRQGRRAAGAASQ
jgi:ribosomal protein L12E/L44/L45/RPP1/RPP2